MKLYAAQLELVLLLVANIGTAEIIDCSFDMSVWWEMSDSIYVCRVRNEEIFNGQPVTVDEAEGEHEPYMSDDDVQGFHMTDAPNLIRLPLNLENVFKNLILIRIFTSNLRELAADDFKPFPQLKYLYIEDNKLKVIGDQLFSQMPLLEVLGLGRNIIEHVDQRALSDLSNLRAVYMAGNVCSILDVADSRSKVLAFVEKLEAGGCQSESHVESELVSLRNQLEEQRQEIEKLNQKILDLSANCQNQPNEITLTEMASTGASWKVINLLLIMVSLISLNIK